MLQNGILLTKKINYQERSPRWRYYLG